ncbi:aspartate kinase [Dysgonomonas sp. ZJ709]|uniref:aspartate kinase n=1 Tax=Dysgonomonas sp. ZJ709 TaxID=2709797 RepID=UPI0013EC874C|nr:aspartate kinase [Dysgonomonas sp. ZJ709]
MKVLKFGSASIATAEKIGHVATIATQERGNIIVLSSMRGTAEALAEISDYLYKKNQEGAIEIINRLQSHFQNLVSELFVNQDAKSQADQFIEDKFNHIRSFTKDLFTLFEERVVMAQGELISSELFYIYLKQKGLNVVLLPALDFMRTDKNSTPDPVYIKDKLSALLNASEGADIYITQGYICRNAYGEIDDLHRGGSDYTASLIGAAVSAEEIQIWADVDVMQNNDPRYVKDTTPVRQLNFDEAAELAYFGAKILHPTCISPAKLSNIPVRLKNMQKPEAPGTVISNAIEPHTIKAIAAKENITAIKIKSGRMLLAHGFLRRVFEVFENYQTSIDMLTTSEIGVSLTIDNDRNLQHILDDLKKYGTVSTDSNMVIISVVGDLNFEDAQLAAKILDAVKDISVRMVSYGGSKYNFSFLIQRKDKEKTLQILNDKLFN